MSHGDRKQWNDFVASAPGASFLQSWEWGAFQEAFSISVWRLVTGGGTPQAAALVLQRTLPTGQRWLYVPRGPLFAAQAPAASRADVLQQLQLLGREQRALFVRIEPATVPGGAWRKADHDVQPRHTLVVDVSAPEEQLLENMHAKTRYNIRLAFRKGVRVRFSEAAADVEAFLHLSRQVTGRAQFRFHPDEYYRVMQRVLSPAGRLVLAVAEAGSEILAVHILITFGDTVTYVHGASSSTQRELMAPHLLQWESMRWARARGCKQYDFFGVVPQSPDHPWAGITRFKAGFGGRRVSYVGAYDLVLNATGYWLYAAARRLSRL
ncbi:MAG TPA: peptidoglycan bridge formation glycyltransferase FemA/FemB family protein [Candidatus Andersenbacteria bacterium]|nr:peptidoglycan bridge formation glycyltransferase FemA/FemB family protein [Candidatus Andersenbacteria bacterium]